jgi:hypothetical protein
MTNFWRSVVWNCFARRFFKTKSFDATDVLLRFKNKMVFLLRVLSRFLVIIG